MKRTRRSNIPLDERLEEYRQIMGYITANGGYASDAVKALGLTTVLHGFRRFAESQGFVLKEYALAWKRYGNWLTIPGPYRSEGKARYIVPAICLLCGEKFDLNLINAKTGKSTCCLSCAKSGNYPKKIQNIKKGEVYASIMSWAKEINRFKEYQKLRILINRHQQIELDGITYSLI